MKFVTFEHHNHTHAGVLSGENVISLASAGFATVLDIVNGGPEALHRVKGLAETGAPDASFPLSSVKLHAPIPRPRKIICIGLNYRDHAIESKLEIPTIPVVFSKYASSVIGPGANIVLPKNSVKPDYEAELAVVIGKNARHAKAEDWREYVFGYTNLNDVSARDFQMATSQWMIGKTFDTFAPMGPYLVTADEISDPHNLNISLTINGEILQNSNTRELIFRIPELIAYLSSVFTLEPGDVISTGTPSGVGFSYSPPRWLRAGDSVTVKVQGLGELTNPVVAEI
ncbi:MAG: fumarylacetoacetate hydrolase family protein [Acidobacteriota bacterium]|nr:fumarylacetoacetate hydrolase family protein [Acidobacteriota bacterium]